MDVDVFILVSRVLVRMVLQSQLSVSLLDGPCGGIATEIISDVALKEPIHKNIPHTQYGIEIATSQNTQGCYENEYEDEAFGIHRYPVSWCHYLYHKCCRLLTFPSETTTTPPDQIYGVSKHSRFFWHVSANSDLHHEWFLDCSAPRPKHIIELNPSNHSKSTPIWMKAILLKIYFDPNFLGIFWTAAVKTEVNACTTAEWG